MNRKLFAKADSFVDKIFSFHRSKLSNWQTLILDSVETKVHCQTLLNNFVVKT